MGPLPPQLNAAVDDELRVVFRRDEHGCWRTGIDHARLVGIVSHRGIRYRGRRIPGRPRRRRRRRRQWRGGARMCGSRFRRRGRGWGRRCRGRGRNRRGRRRAGLRWRVRRWRRGRRRQNPRVGRERRGSHRSLGERTRRDREQYHSDQAHREQESPGDDTCHRAQVPRESSEKPWRVVVGVFHLIGSIHLHVVHVRPCVVIGLSGEDYASREWGIWARGADTRGRYSERRRAGLS